MNRSEGLQAKDMRKGDDFFEKFRQKNYLSIVVPISQKLHPRLSFIQGQLRSIDDKHIYYPPHMWHITLKELGWWDEAVSESDLPWVYTQLEKICSQVKPFLVRLQGLSYFPNAVFCKVQGQAMLRALHLKMVRRLQHKVGVSEFERDKFIPHLTLVHLRFSNGELLLSKVPRLSRVYIGKMKVDTICVSRGRPHLLLNQKEGSKDEQFSCARS